MITLPQKNVVVKFNTIPIFLSFFLLIQKKKNLDASCSPNPCSNGKQCSTRLNGDYNCGCSPGYYGGDCETGFIFF